MSNRRRTRSERDQRPPQRRPASTTRAQVASHSYRVLARLHAMPRWVVPVTTVLLVLAGMFGPPMVGGFCLLVVAVFLLWLGYLAWPQLNPGARLTRMLIVAIVAGVGLARMSGIWD